MSSHTLTIVVIASLISIHATSNDFLCTVTQDEDRSISGTQKCDDLVIEGTLHLDSNTHLSADHIDIRSTGSLLIGHISSSVTDVTITMNSVSNEGILHLNGATIDNAVLECHSGSVCSLICGDTGCDGVEMYCDEEALCDFKCDENTECPEYKIVSQQEKELMIHHEIIDEFEAME